MIIEIRKAGFVNKGAELMLYAVLDRVKSRYADAKFCIVPSSVAPFKKRVELGLYQKVSLRRKGIEFGAIAKFIPKKIRDRYGLVLNHEVDIVIDAAGFSYSDQWGSRSLFELAYSAKKWKRHGTKVILVPQAFGPFEKRLNQFNIKKAVSNIDLLFAREQISYDYLIEAVGTRDNIMMAPDFTNLLEGVVPEYFNSIENRFCVVPNYRMIDKTPPKQSDAYLPFMISCVRYLKARNQKPFILVHEGENDLILAQQISDAVGGINIVTEDHPLKIKGILGLCEGTIGSRFHGLVSALSQGIPSLATGWSHKYKMLFKDYGFEDGLLDVMMSEDQIKEKINLIIDHKSKEAIKNTLNQKSKSLKKQSEKMWDDVFNVLGKTASK